MHKEVISACRGMRWKNLQVCMYMDFSGPSTVVWKGFCVMISPILWVKRICQARKILEQKESKCVTELTEKERLLCWRNGGR